MGRRAMIVATSSWLCEEQVRSPACCRADRSRKAEAGEVLISGLEESDEGPQAFRRDVAFHVDIEEEILASSDVGFFGAAQPPIRSGEDRWSGVDAVAQ